MFVMRPFRENDLKVLLECANLGKGMTSLPKNPDTLKTLLKLSITSFKAKGVPPLGEYYGFILEEHETSVAGGVSAIKAVAGAHKVFRFYRLENETLIPEVIEETSSEICSLFLLPAFRKEGIGKLLSLSRLHFIASFKERFSKTVMAELRGYLDESNQSPFWEGVGKKLHPISYNEAAMLNAEADPIADQFFMKAPFSVQSLPETVKECIGKTHKNTAPARNMLEDQGFKWTYRMDIVDAGPQLACYREDLKEIKETQLYTVLAEDLKNEDEEVKIVSNNRLDFRAVLSQFKIKDNQVLLPADAKEALKINPGQMVRI